MVNKQMTEWVHFYFCLGLSRTWAQLLLNGFLVVLVSTVLNGSDFSINSPVVGSWLIYHVCLSRA